MYVQHEGVHLLIDAGPDIRQQALQNNLQQVDALLLTHNHADHTAGIDDLRPFHFRNGKPMDLYAESMVLEDLEKRFHYAFHPKPYPGTIQLKLHAIRAFESFTIDCLPITPLRIHHGDLPILGFKIGELVYLTDVKTIPEQTMQLISKCSVLVINALRRQSHPSHLNLQEALDYISAIRPKHALLTHLSHHLGLHDELMKDLPNFVQPAYDGLCLTI